MAGLERYMRILRLFGEDQGDWTIADMAAALGLPASTVYRTVREMTDAGLLEASSGARYGLGAFFIEFDRLVRVTDPLYRIGAPLLRELTIQARTPCAAVVARLYNNQVMCVADVRSEGDVPTSYERGRPRPLTRGATSKAILAQLPPRRLSKLLARTLAQMSGEAFDLDSERLRKELAAIRKRGYCVTRGEVDEGLLGIAAPVALPERGLVASLSLILESPTVTPPFERRMALLVVSTASLLTEELAAPLRRAPERAAC